MFAFLRPGLTVLPVTLLACFYLGSCRSVKVTAIRSDLEIPGSFSSLDKAGTHQPPAKEQLFSDPNLVHLIDIAVQQNRDIKIAAERIEAAKAQLHMRRGALLPSVELSATGSGTRYGDYTMEGVGNFDTNLSPNIDEHQKVPRSFTPNVFLGFRSTWEVDLWGKLKNSRRSAYLRLLASEQGRRLVVTSLVSEVASRYYELMALDAEIEVMKKNLDLQDSAVAIAEVQKEAGRTTELGVQQFKAQQLRTRGLLVKAEQEVVRVENELNLLLGRFPRHITRSKLSATRQIPVTDITLQPNAILNARPDVVQAELELKAANYDVAAAKAELLPGLVLSPYVGYNSFNPSLLFNPGSLAYGIVGGLAAPVLNRSAITSNISKTKAEQKQALYGYEQILFNVFREIQTELSNLSNLQRAYDFNSREVSILLDAVATSNELFKAGYASYLEVITAQKNAIEAEINAIETRKNMYYSLINLYRATGGGW